MQQPQGYGFGQHQTTAVVNPLNTAVSSANTGSGFNFGTANASNTGISTTTGFSGGLGQPSTGSLFSQTSTASGGLFGQTPAATLGTTAPISGFSFGTSSTPATTSASTVLSLLTSQTPASTNTLLNLGQTNTSTATIGGLFGTVSAAPTSTIPSTGNTGLFGSITASTPSISSTGNTGLFGNAPSAPGGLFGQPTAAPKPGFFGQPASTNVAPGGLFGQQSSSGLFGTNTLTSTGFNLGASTSTAISGSTPSLGLGGSLPTSTTVAGLGGFQPPTIDAGSGSTTTKGDGKCAKEAPLPNDIFATLAIFEAYKESEKKSSEENVRQTAAPFHKLGDDTKKLRQHIVKLSNQHAQLHASAKKLKSCVIQEAENVEMARRTQETPIALQGDNKSPEVFFLRLVRSFEERMTFCKNKIDEVEKCSRNNGSASEVTSEDMKKILKKEHEMIKMLAAKVYTLHNQLLNQCNKLSSQNKPEAFFKPQSTELHHFTISNKNSTIIRPCVGDTESGLINFQNGQQRAKAVSLGASPTVGGQASVPNVFLSSNPANKTGGSSLFSSFNNNNNTISNPSGGLNFGTGNSSSLNFGNTSSNLSFGNASPGLNFGTGSTPAIGFGSGNSTAFGTPKPFGK